MNRFAVERRESRQVIGPEMSALERPQVLLRWGDSVNRVSVHRVERRIGLRLFDRWFGFESSTTQRWVETLQLTKTQMIEPGARPAPRGRLALAGGGALAIALLGGAIGALLVPTAPQAANGVPLTTTLPASRPIAMPGVATAPQRVIVQRIAVAAPAAAPAAAGASVPGAVTVENGTAPDNGVPLSQARAAALTSGEPAYWSEGDRSGVVVAGPERSENGQLCRLIAIFTRSEGDRGSTQSTTQCRAAAGTAKN